MMDKTILKVYEDNTGRLYFSTDLPQSLDGEEEDRLTAILSEAVRHGLEDEKKVAVVTAVRQLAFGAILCASDLERAMKEFRFHVKANKKAPRTGRP